MHRHAGSARVVLAAVLVAVGLLPLTADEAAQPPKADATAPPDAQAARKAYDPSRRVPPHFAKVGLSTEQREKIYKIRATHQVQIDRLRRELEERQARMLAECEAVLTDSQKTLLQEHRQGAGRANPKGVETTSKADAR